VHAAASRRPVDRRNQQDARARHERGEAQRVPRGEKTAPRAGATQESGIVSTHYSEDDLTLYYYGEGNGRARIEHHLEECSACAAVYREISGTLSMVVAEDVPERGEHYGLEVWQRIRHKLPEQESGFKWFNGFKGFMGFAAAAAVLMIAAFVAGRF